jgi:hypothetical protein
VVAFATRYAYLACSLAYAILVVVLARCTVSRVHFRLTILSGLASVPAFVFLIFLEGHYWNPVRVGGLALGIEDAVISFAVAAMTWYGVALVGGRRLSAPISVRASVRRYVLAAIGCDITFLAAVWSGIDPMTALLLTCALAAAVLWARRQRNWPLGASGMALFPLTWFAVVKASFWLLPDFVFQWNLAGIWGTPVLGVPSGEIAWSVVFGAFWPLFIAHVYDMTYHRRPA